MVTESIFSPPSKHWPDRRSEPRTQKTAAFPPWLPPPSPPPPPARNPAQKTRWRLFPTACCCWRLRRIVRRRAFSARNFFGSGQLAAETSLGKLPPFNRRYLAPLPLNASQLLWMERCHNLTSFTKTSFLKERLLPPDQTRPD